MYTGQPEKYISTVFAFGEKNPLNANATQVLKGYLTAPGGATTLVTPTGTAAEFAVVIPRNGVLKNLYWNAEASTLTATGNSITVYVKDPPTAPTPAPTGLTVSWNGNVKSGFNITNTVPVVAGDTVSVFLQIAKGSGILTRPRVTIELEVDNLQYPNPWDLTGSIVSYMGGNVGIGTASPAGALHVKNAAAAGIAGVFETPATGKILSGKVGASEKFSVDGGGNLYASGKVGIGNTTPSTELDVNGTIQTKGLKLTTGANNGFVLTSDASGAGTWQPAGGAGGSIDGSGTVNAIPKFFGATTLDDSVIFENGGNIGIGTSTPGSTLQVNGTVRLGGTAPNPGVDVDLAGNVGIGGGLSVAGGLSTGGTLGVAGNISFGSILSTPGRMHVTGGELLYLLNPSGVVIGREWGGNGNLFVEGALTVQGPKNFVQEHPTDPTKEIVYTSLEGGEAGTYMRGTGKLVNGKATINLPEHFSLVTNEEGLTVQVTPRDEWLSLYVSERSTKQILVNEAQGKSGQFDYLIQGVRQGYENQHVIREKQAHIAPTMDEAPTMQEFAAPPIAPPA